MTEHEAFAEAVKVGAQSPCAKSKRGVVIFNRTTQHFWGRGYNHPPRPFVCARTQECREACGRICIHAEQDAICDAQSDAGFADCEMLHIKVEDGKPVPSGSPSCVECSKLILHYGFSAMWLYEDRGDGSRLYRYAAEEFHMRTLQNLGLPVLTPPGE